MLKKKSRFFSSKYCIVLRMNYFFIIQYKITLTLLLLRYLVCLISYTAFLKGVQEMVTPKTTPTL